MARSQLCEHKYLQLLSVIFGSMSSTGAEKEVAQWPWMIERQRGLGLTISLQVQWIPWLLETTGWQHVLA